MRRPQDDETEEAWTLGPDEHALLSGKRGANRLGFAVLMRFFAREGRFPDPAGEAVGAEAVAHVAGQVGVPAAEYGDYDRAGRTYEYHRAQIREAFGFRPATVEDAEKLAGWLSDEVGPHEYDPERLVEAAYARLRALKVEPPAPGRVERAARSALRRYDERFRQQTLSRLSPEALTELDALLLGPDALRGAPTGPDGADDARSREAEEATLSRLRADPGRASLESAFAEISKLMRLRAVGLPDDLFADVQPKVVRAYRRRAAAEPPSSLRAHPAPVRYALMSALCHERLREVTDGLVDLLIRIVHRIGARAERKVERAMVRDFRRVHGKQGMLVRVAEASLNNPDGTVREVVFPAVAERTLAEIVREAKAQGAAFRQQVQTRMRSSYVGHYRRLVPALLSALSFRSSNALYRPVLLAVDLMRAHAGDGRRFFRNGEEVPLEGVVPPAWMDAVVREDGRGRRRVERAAYELCALESLRESLRSKEVWVVGADRYRNPDEDLPQDFDERRASYYGLLDQPMAADRFVEDLRGRMEEALNGLDRGYPRNPHLLIRERGKGRVRLSPLPKQPEPPNLDALRADVSGRWPMTGLLDILKEADLRLGFTDLLTTVASRQALPSDVLRKRLLLCLYGLGTNAGLKRVAAGDEGSTYSDLRYVRRRFVHKEQLRAATARVADGVFVARDPALWGEATTACASDSKKFGAWDQNLMTEWHIRYGGRGVMIYWKLLWFVKPRYIGFGMQPGRRHEPESRRFGLSGFVFGNVRRQGVCDVLVACSLGLAVVGEFLQRARDGRGHQRPVDFAGHVALEAPHDLLLGLAFRAALGDVAAGALVGPEAADHDHVQRPVGLAVAVAVEAVADGVARGGGDRGDAAEVGEGRLVPQALGVVAGGHQQHRGRFGADALGGHEARRHPHHETPELGFERDDLLAERAR